MQAAVPEVELIEGDRSKVATELADVDGVIGPFDVRLLNRAPRRKWIQAESPGVEAFIFLPGFAQSKSS
jgi:hypothetical protein